MALLEDKESQDDDLVQWEGMSTEESNTQAVEKLLSDLLPPSSSCSGIHSLFKWSSGAWICYDQTTHIYLVSSGSSLFHVTIMKYWRQNYFIDETGFLVGFFNHYFFNLFFCCCLDSFWFKFEGSGRGYMCIFLSIHSGLSPFSQKGYSMAL